MDKLIVADIHADVADRIDAVGEEHEVARLKVAFIDLSAIVVPLPARAAPERVAVLAVKIIHEARAVKAARRGAAVNIGRSEILLCGGDDLVGNGIAGAELDIVCAHISAQAVVAHGIP